MYYDIISLQHGHSHSEHHENEKEEKTQPKNHEAHADKERRNEVLRKLKTASVLCFSFFLVEVIGGILSGSLAVLSDAAHLCADLSAFLVGK